MAARALAAEATVVHIVLVMAARAVAAQARSALRRVAAGAAGLAVRAVERESGERVVVIPQRPGACVVAARAVIAVAAVVGVVLEMATGAAGQRIGVELGAMALRAFERAVAADQRKASAVVLVAAGLPRLFVVAVDAGIAQAGLVHIVLAMALDAPRGRCELGHRRAVAVLALRLGVRAA